LHNRENAMTDIYC